MACFDLICPCYRTRKKDVREDPVLCKNTSVNNPSELGSVLDGLHGLQVSPSPTRFSLSPKPSTPGTLHLNINQIMKITQNFAPALKIGEGHFGTVYKAELPGGQVVAIKRAKKEHFGSFRAEFRNEVSLLTKIEHTNLVRLLGYVENGNESIIVTEYVPNGNLREHLDGKRGTILDFSQRLEIAIGIAHGLTYLHTYAEKNIIHRDVKSSNILLTESFKAKVSDFGLAKAGPTEPDQSQIASGVKGTAGYLDPEYLKTNRFAQKSDVFSFGILLLEIMSARRPIDLRGSLVERITVRWAFEKYNQGNMREILDPKMQESVHEAVLDQIFVLAFRCAAPTRDDRPGMKEVVERLWKIRKAYAGTQARVKQPGRSSS